MLYFLAAFVLSVFFTLLVRLFARHTGIMDRPDGVRKRHAQPVALLGGVAIFLAFWIVLFYLLRHPVFGIELIENKLYAAFFGSLIILFVGIADDIRPFGARTRLVLVSLAIMCTVLFGPWLTRVTNPFGGFVELSAIVGNVIVFCWLMGMTYTTKILDGVDGLATGIVTIGALFIFFLTQSSRFFQPNVGLVAAIFAGACLGFLVFNFSPASIFLGESGSLFIGFLLGTLAIISGGKLATALLVMAVPIFDVARVVYLRLRRHQPVFQGDREHLHFQLLDSGMRVRTVVVLFYILAVAFGLTTLFLQSYQKLLALFLVGMGMLVVFSRFNKK